MELIFDRLTKQYKNKIAVDQFSYKMSTGIYGLLGVNGAGKTTIMRMISTILHPTAGDILLNENSIYKLGQEYCDVIGYLPQEFGYYPDFTAYDFMLYMASIKGIKSYGAKRRTEELLEIVGLKEVGKQKINTYSGGMKQRLGIAQAVLNDPKILILDEPTQGLDPKERIRFRNLISDLAKNKIVILSTHIVSDVEYIADQILFIQKGKLILEGEPAKLIKEQKGIVWQIEIDEHELSKYDRHHCISNLHHTNSGVALRIVSKDKPMDLAKEVPTTLEDLFLYYFGNDMKREKRDINEKANNI